MSSNNLYNCPKCGAQLDPGSFTCPYCGYENEEKAREREEKNLIELQQKHRQKLKALPGKMLNRYTLILGAVLALLILTCAGYAIVRSAVKNMEAKQAYQEKEAMLSHLEDLYRSGDYEKLKDEYYDSGYYGASFGKYSNTAEVYSLCKYAVSSLTLAAEAEVLRTPDHVGECLRAAFHCLARCRKLREEGFRYDEGQAVTSMEAEVTAVLSDVWGLTEQEIAEGVDRYADQSTDYSGLAAELITRSANRTGD